MDIAAVSAFLKDRFDLSPAGAPCCSPNGRKVAAILREALGIKYETARTCLKSVFRETKTRRQAELVMVVIRAMNETNPPPPSQLHRRRGRVLHLELVQRAVRAVGRALHFDTMPSDHLAGVAEHHLRALRPKNEGKTCDIEAVWKHKLASMALRFSTQPNLPCRNSKTGLRKRLSVWRIDTCDVTRAVKLHRFQ